MDSLTYREPTVLERAFLGVVTAGYPILERQIRNCQIADYDPVGFCHIFVVEPTAFPQRNVNGPTLLTAELGVPSPYVETILWTNRAGKLCTIEIIAPGPKDIEEPYADFVRAAQTLDRLMYLVWPPQARDVISDETFSP